MSSEMRELLKKYETRLANFERLYGYNEQAGADARWNRAHMLQCRDIVDDLRALLARTEAGADGAVWMYRHAKRGGPWSTFHNEQHRANTERDPTWEVRAFYPHPQDASGDVDAARRYRWARDHVGGTAWNDDNFATVTIGVKVPKSRGTCAFDVTAEMLDAAIDAAMQAKEAK